MSFLRCGKGSSCHSYHVPWTTQLDGTQPSLGAQVGITPAGPCWVLLKEVFTPHQQDSRALKTEAGEPQGSCWQVRASIHAGRSWMVGRAWLSASPWGPFRPTPTDSPPPHALSVSLLSSTESHSVVLRTRGLGQESLNFSLKCIEYALSSFHSLESLGFGDSKPRSSKRSFLCQSIPSPG